MVADHSHRTEAYRREPIAEVARRRGGKSRPKACIYQKKSLLFLHESDAIESAKFIEFRI